MDSRKVPLAREDQGRFAGQAAGAAPWILGILAVVGIAVAANWHSIAGSHRGASNAAMDAKLGLVVSTPATQATTQQAVQGQQQPRATTTSQAPQQQPTQETTNPTAPQQAQQPTTKQQPQTTTSSSGRPAQSSTQAPTQTAAGTTPNTDQTTCVRVRQPNLYTDCGPGGSTMGCVATTTRGLFGSSFWGCTVVIPGTAPYHVTEPCISLQEAMTCRQRAVSRAQVLMDAGGCPQAVTGTISGLGNRIPLQVRIVGPTGSRIISAILDTGGVTTQLPDADMRAIGDVPVGSISTSWPLVSRGTLREYQYRVPYPQVYDHGAWVPLGWGTMTIYGVQAIPAGVGPLVGPDVLKAGTQLSTAGQYWSLVPPCPGQ